MGAGTYWKEEEDLWQQEDGRVGLKGHSWHVGKDIWAARNSAKAITDNSKKSGFWAQIELDR